jgi:hypothetical protein
VETDVLCLLVPLIEERPWLRTTSKGDREIFDNQKWNVVPKEDYSRIPKLEAQVWLAVYNLFMDPECRKKYEINEFRKGNLLRLRKYMNETLMDQIPMLNDMLRTLEELSLTQVNTSLNTNSLVVQQMPELKAEITKNRNWKEIAEYQKNNFFLDDEKTRKQDLERLQSVYNYGIMEGLMEGFKCVVCQKEGIKRCSQCKQEFYCTRECQVQHWPEHKKTCKPIPKEPKPDDDKNVKSQPSKDEQRPKKSPMITDITKGETKPVDSSKDPANVKLSDAYDELE